MSENRFIQLVQDHDGFEFYQAFQNDVDHILGGKPHLFTDTDTDPNTITVNLNLGAYAFDLIYKD